MKGRLLTIEEILDLKNGTKVWLEKDILLDEDYNQESKLYKLSGERFYSDDESCSVYANIYKNGIAIRTGKIKVYEWKEDVKMKEYSFKEVIARIEEGQKYEGTINNYDLESIEKLSGGYIKIKRSNEFEELVINPIQKFVLVSKPVTFMEAA